MNYIKQFIKIEIHSKDQLCLLVAQKNNLLNRLN